MLILRPSALTECNPFITANHRHNKKVVGCRFCLKAIDEGRIVGVAIVGRPVARMIDQETTAEITRLCVLDDAPKNTPSFLYGACRRVWQTMGGAKLITYTLESESGASLRGAGYEVAAHCKPRPRGWGCNVRERENLPIYAEPKIRRETVTESNVARQDDRSAS